MYQSLPTFSTYKNFRSLPSSSLLAKQRRSESRCPGSDGVPTRSVSTVFWNGSRKMLEQMIGKTGQKKEILEVCCLLLFQGLFMNRSYCLRWFNCNKIFGCLFSFSNQLPPLNTVIISVSEFVIRKRMFSKGRNRSPLRSLPAVVFTQVTPEMCLGQKTP